MKLSKLPFLALFAIFLVLAGCQSGDDALPLPSGDSGPQFEQSKVAISNPIPYSVSEVSTQAGQRILRTELTIAFSDNATTEDVDTLIDSLNAQITSNIKGTRYITVRVPDPGSLVALDTLIDRIEAEEFVLFVRKSIFSSTKELPPNLNPQLTRSYVSHHLAVRGHNLWAVRDLFTNSPLVVIADYFGDGSPSLSDSNYVPFSLFDSPFVSLTSDQADTLREACSEKITNSGGTVDADDCQYPSNHGYHVAGIISGKFASTRTTDRDSVVGMFPGLITLDALDLISEELSPGDGWNNLLNTLISYTGSSTIILNLSIGYECETGLTDNNCVGNERLQDDVFWWMDIFRNTPTEKGIPLEDYVLVVSAAGNIDEDQDPLNPVIDASKGSEYNNAALQPDIIIPPMTTTPPPLTNTLVVENASAEIDVFSPDVPKCVHESSFINGNIAAIGEDVHSFTDSSSTAGSESGTSMAAPQVAGLAASLLSAKPNLTPQQIKRIIISTANNLDAVVETGCSVGYGSRIIDAQSAILAIDSDLSPRGAPVRMQLLDVVANATDPAIVEFNQEDLEKFLELLDPNTPNSPSSPNASTQDKMNYFYSRYDLNGDGYTGGVTRAKFDLDVKRVGVVDGFGMPVLDTIESEIYNGLSASFDESNLTDMEILCYYAYSPLYTMSENDKRDELLEGLCTSTNEFIVSGNKLNGILEYPEASSWSLPSEPQFGSITRFNTGSGFFTYEIDETKLTPLASEDTFTARVTYLEGEEERTDTITVRIVLAGIFNKTKWNSMQKWGM